jgi:hypothetical protein
VHAPVNGSEARANTTPDGNFTFTIARAGGRAQAATAYFAVPEPRLETWNFTWFEGEANAPDISSRLLKLLDLFARDARRPSLVRVAAKAYRNVVLTDPGEYTATLRYYNGSTTVANWLVRDVPAKRRAKNLILFIGDGMTTNMITGKHMICSP